ncbi:endoribonuclease L-PSP [Fusarium bulbicola]|nr:endoribonuclease L-PSP [Fusarium bulbicola]
MPKAQFFDYPGTEANGEAFHYSQVARIGNVLRTSGQGGWDAQGNIIADPQAQVEQAFQNVLIALRAAHPTAEWSNVVSVRTYHTNVEARKLHVARQGPLAII